MDTGYWKLRQDSPIINSDSYRKMIGALLYVAVNTRPDIAAPIAILGQHVEAPKRVDWVEVKRVARYLKETIDYELRLSGNDGRKSTLEGYADANWAEDRENRKSNSGYVFKLNGGAVSWACRKQGCVALSSTEAELVALAEICQETVWLRKLLESFGKTQKNPTTIYEDNQSCINRLKTGGFTNRTKHIDTKYFYARELETAGEITIKYCPTESNEADMLTKAIGAINMKKLCENVGLKKWN
ncbi:uncharacterized protein [Temnothorax longispinosus]|uniref:uncharacterized protein n=1 Tax=Temnothorax longispinosus TaxID=300112 RepID=UPI003A9909EA